MPHAQLTPPTAQTSRDEVAETSTSVASASDSGSATRRVWATRHLDPCRRMTATRPADTFPTAHASLFDVAVIESARAGSRALDQRTPFQCRATRVGSPSALGPTAHTLRRDRAAASVT